MSDPKAEFERLLAELRPRLHRYCARMTGSVIDGEDVLQETLVKAIEAFPHTGPLANVEGWLFRIAHNAALDFLRRRSRREGVQGDEELETIADPDSEIERRQAAAASLRTPDAPAGGPAQQRHPDGRAGPFARGDLGSAGEHGARGQSQPASRPPAAGRVRRRARRPAAAGAGRGRPPAACRLCRALQRPRFRCAARPACRRSEGRGREPHAPQRPRRGQPLLRQLQPVAATGISCRAWSTGVRRSLCTLPTSRPARRSTSCCWTGPTTACSRSATSAMPATPWRGPN